MLEWQDPIAPWPFNFSTNLLTVVLYSCVSTEHVWTSIFLMGGHASFKGWLYASNRGCSRLYEDVPVPLHICSTVLCHRITRAGFLCFPMFYQNTSVRIELLGLEQTCSTALVHTFCFSLPARLSKSRLHAFHFGARIAACTPALRVTIDCFHVSQNLCLSCEKPVIHI